MLLNSEKNDIRNILLIVPNVQLVKQFYEDMTDYGILTSWNVVNFSSDQDKKNKKKKIEFEFKDKNIIISNAQWLMLHGDELPYIDCIIQDEVHVVKKRC
jgi:superfamily II DNA or RNA helicase